MIFATMALSHIMVSTIIGGVVNDDRDVLQAVLDQHFYPWPNEFVRTSNVTLKVWFDDRDRALLKKGREPFAKRIDELKNCQPLVNDIVQICLKQIAIEEGGCLFVDVAPGHWAYREVQELGARGLLRGYANGKFHGVGKSQSSPSPQSELALAAGTNDVVALEALLAPRTDVRSTELIEAMYIACYKPVKAIVFDLFLDRAIRDQETEQLDGLFYPLCWKEEEYRHRYPEIPFGPALPEENRTKKVRILAAKFPHLIDFADPRVTPGNYAITPFGVACRNGDVPMARLLNSMGADTKSLYKGGLAIIGAGNAATVRYLVAIGQSPDTRNGLGLCALEHALSNEEGSLKALIECGAMVNARSPTGFTPLMRLATFDDKPTVLKDLELLLKAKAWINARDNLGRSAIHFCWHNEKFLDRLLSKGANIKLTANNGDNALHSIVRQAAPPQGGRSGMDLPWKTYRKVVVRLIAAGLSPNQKNSVGESAIELAKRLNWDEGARELERLRTKGKE